MADSLVGRLILRWRFFGFVLTLLLATGVLLGVVTVDHHLWPTTIASASPLKDEISIELERIESPRNIAEPISLSVKLRRGGLPFDVVVEVLALATPLDSPTIVYEQYLEPVSPLKPGVYEGQLAKLEQEGSYDVRIEVRTESGLLTSLIKRRAFSVFAVPRFGVPSIVGSHVVGQPFTVTMAAMHIEKLPTDVMLEVHVKRVDGSLDQVVRLRLHEEPLPVEMERQVGPDRNKWSTAPTQVFDEGTFLGTGQPLTKPGWYQIVLDAGEMWTTDGVKFSPRPVLCDVEFYSPGVLDTSSTKVFAAVTTLLLALGAILGGYVLYLSNRPLDEQLRRVHSLEKVPVARNVVPSLKHFFLGRNFARSKRDFKRRVNDVGFALAIGKYVQTLIPDLEKVTLTEADIEKVQKSDELLDEAIESRMAILRDFQRSPGEEGLDKGEYLWELMLKEVIDYSSGEKADRGVLLYSAARLLAALVTNGSLPFLRIMMRLARERVNPYLYLLATLPGRGHSGTAVTADVAEVLRAFYHLERLPDDHVDRFEFATRIGEWTELLSRDGDGMPESDRSLLLSYYTEIQRELCRKRLPQDGKLFTGAPPDLFQKGTLADLVGERNLTWPRRLSEIEVTRGKNQPNWHDLGSGLDHSIRHLQFAFDKIMDWVEEARTSVKPEVILQPVGTSVVNSGEVHHDFLVLNRAATPVDDIQIKQEVVGPDSLSNSSSLTSSPLEWCQAGLSIGYRFSGPRPQDGAPALEAYLQPVEAQPMPNFSLVPNGREPFRVVFKPQENRKIEIHSPWRDPEERTARLGKLYLLLTLSFRDHYYDEDYLEKKSQYHIEFNVTSSRVRPSIPAVQNEDAFRQHSIHMLTGGNTQIQAVLEKDFCSFSIESQPGSSCNLGEARPEDVKAYLVWVANRPSLSRVWSDYREQLGQEQIQVLDRVLKYFRREVEGGKEPMMCAMEESSLERISRGYPIGEAIDQLARKGILLVDTDRPRCIRLAAWIFWYLPEPEVSERSVQSTMGRGGDK